MNTPAAKRYSFGQCAPADLSGSLSLFGALGCACTAGRPAL